MLGRDKRGATAVEFAILALPMCAFLVGSLEIGYQLYATSILQGTINQAGRMASLEDASQTSIDAFVKQRLGEFTTSDRIVISSKSFRSFNGIGNPEVITTDTAPLGAFNLGDCYIDANNSKNYDTAQGTSGTGGAEDVVNYQVTMTYDRLMPVVPMFGMSATETLIRSTVLRNEPYAGVVDPDTICTKKP